MSSRPNDTNSLVRLPAILAIGFTGHRKLPDEVKSRQLIRDFLEQQKSATRGIVSGVSSAAAGGGLLFAESCIELGIPLRVLFSGNGYLGTFMPLYTEPVISGRSGSPSKKLTITSWLMRGSVSMIG